MRIYETFFVSLTENMQPRSRIILCKLLLYTIKILFLFMGCEQNKKMLVEVISIKKEEEEKEEGGGEEEEEEEEGGGEGGEKRRIRRRRSR